MNSKSDAIKKYCDLHGIDYIDIKLVETPFEIFKGISFTVSHEWQMPSSEPLVKVKEKA